MLGVFWIILWFAVAAAFGLEKHPIDVPFVLFDLIPGLLLIVGGFAWSARRAKKS
jgi:hypothetical protein